MVVYGNNVLDEVSSELSFLDEDWFVLSATSLEFDSLKPGLDAKSIFLLKLKTHPSILPGMSLSQEVQQSSRIWKIILLQV